jgi:5'-nucleotidase
MRVLVTNDDGVHAPGLHALAIALDEDGHDLLIVAPATDWSGGGAAIGPLHVSGRVAYQQVELDGLRHVPTFAVEGPPALAVLTACLGGYGSPPAIVVAGVNAGANTGSAILHSGTVGAALTAAQLGKAAAAVSLDLGSHAHWATAGAVATAVADWLEVIDQPIVLNVNVPNVPLRQVRGVRTAQLASVGTIQSGFVPVADGHLQLEIWDEPRRPMRDGSADESCRERASEGLRGEQGGSAGPGTDAGLVRCGYVAVTELTGLHAAPSASVDALPTLIEDTLLDAVRTSS